MESPATTRSASWPRSWPQSWEDPQCAFRLEWAPLKLDRIRIAVVDAFYALPRGGIEIGGLLLGSVMGQVVSVEDWAPIACEHLTGPSFVLSAKDEAALSGQLSTLNSHVVGWFHSHTRSALQFSPQDLAIHQKYFPQPFQVALVLRPANMQPVRANYFFRDKSGILVPGASEFNVEAVRGETTARPRSSPAPTFASPVQTPPTPPTPPPSAPPPISSPPPQAPPQAIKAPPPVPSAPVAPEIFPVIRQAPARNHTGWPLLIALVIFALAAAAFLTRETWMPKSLDPLKLQASDLDGKLLIRWMPVRNAQTGQLHIMDGTKAIDVTLDAIQLSRGFYLFARQAVNNTVQLKVDTREETTSFAGPLTTPRSSADLDQTESKIKAERQDGR